jgi:hypothetical protein
MASVMSCTESAWLSLAGNMSREHQNQVIDAPLTKLPPYAAPGDLLSHIFGDICFSLL